MNIKPKRNFRIIVSIAAIIALAVSVFFYMIFSSATEWRCLQEGEIFEYKVEEKGIRNGALNIFIKDNKSQEIKSKITIDDISTSAYPVELRKCGIYVIREFDYDPNKIKQDIGYREEFWKYDYTGKGKPILLLSEKPNEFIGYYSSFFRTSDDEKYVALIKGWYGEPEEHAVVIKDLDTMEDIHTITFSELMEKYGIEQGTLTLSSWYEQWCKFTIINGGDTFFHLDVTNGDMKVYY
ncbi:hypothetical protein KAI54_01925 [Candidatus Gracilibacteria bacterium]|nr:hypothetical protein [Candidatus Gracilibacteria bacterium]